VWALTKADYPQGLQYNVPLAGSVTNFLFTPSFYWSGNNGGLPTVP
jgi:hypothetical protein